MPRNSSPSAGSPRSTRSGNINNTNNFTTTSTTSVSPAKSTTSGNNNNNSAAAGRNLPAHLNLDSTLNSSNGDTTLSKTNPFSSQGMVVAVRVRPFNKRELKEPVAQISTSQSVAAIVNAAPGKQGVTLQADTSVPEPIVDVEVDGRTVSILDPSKNYAVKVGFQFDHVFSPFVALEFEGTNNSSMMMMKSARMGNGNEEDGQQQQQSEDSEAVEKEQQRIFQLLGVPVVENALFGFNTCLFCYGATASGKTFTMMGTKAEPGIVPRVCRTLFKKLEAERIAQKTAELTAEVEGLEHCEGAKPQQNAAPVKKEVKIQVQYLEIYQERVRDLLRPRERVKDDGGREKKPKWNVGSVEEEFLSLKVRQHPIYGPFVDGLTKLEVTSWIDCVKLIRQGNELRVAATTDMNDSSSRSHAIFQIMVTQTEVFGAKVRGKDIVNHRTSKINLVDLAGSERQGKTNVTGKHLIEANYINTSLSTLRKVIDVLNIKKKGGSSSEKIVVPYRESLLTWILSDNFGGNSKTAMIANVSPHWSSLQDSESTLRYATLAKGIVNRIRVNEDPSAKLIRDLQNQLRHLQDELRRANTSSAPATPSAFFNGGGGGGGNVMTREIEEQMEENKKALEELETKENGMMEIIREARQREEQLRMEKEGLERDQLRWKREAERLAREKVELLALLQKHGLDAGAKGNSANFWHDGSAAGSEYGGGDTGSNLDALKKNQKKAKKSKGDDDDGEDSRQTTPQLGVAKKKKRQEGRPGRDDESETNDGRRQESSILDESSPSVVNESFSCPIVQPKKYARRRTSVIQPSDIIPPGTTGLEDSGDSDSGVRNISSSESNSNRDRERRSTSASSNSNQNNNSNNILSSPAEKYHQNSNSSSMPPPPSSLPPDVAMLRHQRMQNQQLQQQIQQNNTGKVLPNSRGSANSALASRDVLSSDDRNAAAMLLGSLITEHQSNHKRKNSKTSFSSNNNNNNNNNDDGTSSNTSRKSSKRSKQPRADSADSSNSSRREREGKESKSKKEKKDKKDKKTSGRKDSLDEELVDPFAEFGPKSSSAGNNASSSVSTISKKPSILGISHSSSPTTLAVLTETSIPPLLSHEKDYALLSKNNSGLKPTSSASSTSAPPALNSNNSSNNDSGGTPQHGRRSAPGGGGSISTPSSINNNNNSNPNLPPLPFTGRRSANNNSNHLPPSVSPPPQGAPLSLIGNSSNSRNAVSPSQPQFHLQNNNVNGSFGGSRPNSNAHHTNDSLDQFMQNGNGEQNRATSGRRKNVQ